ncbi:PTS system, glucitol/sorbitol-specific IIA component [Evansella caseinilytica]|uniref:PTS system, glucitol/sorbitol-specific IIA component n=1 Tax=Evansella caseinilytica TaxID=1503961 RepID=A0A1H3H820_9BACI|nr:PTS glucitol/sorbitol transporter subunit IIA [Evansella caseinilytica]SDY11591.1 PTS system, glucitol/sorbitol-specific IIA component [Evansella caseinilytica]
MNRIYYTQVTTIGPLALDFFEEKMFILFTSDAPEELMEYCIIHKENRLEGEIQPGDTFKIGESEYKVTAVGDAVNQNLGALGHMTVRINGSLEADLPGTLCLEEKAFAGIFEGDCLEIIRF